MIKMAITELPSPVLATRTLTTQEIYVLRLILHGYTIFEIIDFLNIEADHYFRSVSNIKFKLGAGSFYKVCVKSFELKIVNPSDFINDIVKQKALHYSKDIAAKIALNQVSAKAIKNDILKFYSACKEVLKTSRDLGITFDEKAYLKLKFKGFSDDTISKRLELNISLTDSIREQLFIKLKNDIWYYIFKKVFELGILNSKEYISLDIDLDATNLSNNLITGVKLNSLSEKEKQLLVYDALLRFYTDIEINYLSKSKL